MVVLGIINAFLFLLKLILTPIGAAMTALGINTLISNFNELIGSFIDLCLSDGIHLAAYFFNWSLVKPLFIAWGALFGVAKAYNIYRAIRKQVV